MPSFGRTTTTTRPAPASCAVAIVQCSIGRPQTGWRTFGVCDRIRVPWPAAMTSTVGREGTSRSVAKPMLTLAIGGGGNVKAGESLELEDVGFTYLPPNIAPASV